METILSLLVGLGLSAACGFRVFVPVLVAGIASRLGHLPLAPDFAWMASNGALAAFAMAAAIEVAGYWLPWLDHALDVLATPAAVVAGTLITASVATDMSPFMKWSLALIAGGGLAGLVQTTTVMGRVVSLAGTGGVANPLFATVESGAAVLTSVMALVLPVLTFLLALGLVVLVGMKVGRRGGGSSARRRGVRLDRAEDISMAER